ncbi:MAG: Creatinine amidohydrolase [Phycisphaerae bacterium]|nr:Creatinine amidohydrolase [Phycisphaerae bacterium]
MAECRMEWLKPDDYRRIKRETPIAYLPWGAHEWHGKHAVLGLDSLKADCICLALAQRTGGVVFPPVYCGHGTMQRHGQDCTLEFPVELIEQMARHYFLQLRVEGFRVVVAVLGHYGRDHVRAIQRMAEWVNSDFAGVLRVIAEPDYAWTSPEMPGDHAGANETSYMMHFAPDSVDLSRLPSVADSPRLDAKAEGVGGPDPRTEASADRGRRQLEMLLEHAVPQIQGALAGLR